LIQRDWRLSYDHVSAGSGSRQHIALVIERVPNLAVDLPDFPSLSKPHVSREALPCVALRRIGPERQLGLTLGAKIYGAGESFPGQ